jgi:outer membrane protein assembly factor BamB
MATDGQRVYAIFSNGDIIALDFAGNRVWAKNLGVPKNHYGHSSSLITIKNKLIVQYDQGAGGQVMALSITTGDVLWSTPRKVKISWASPILISNAGRTEIVLVADPFVAGYDPETGTELWSIKGVIGEVGPSAAFEDGVVFVTNEYSKTLAIKIGEKPEALWESDEYLSDVPSPVATKDLLFLVTSYGAVACYNAKTGDIFWEHEFDQGFYSSPMLVENRIYLINKQGVTHIFKADKVFELIAEPKLGEKSVCTPAFSNGRIYFRTETSLFCIGS